MSNPVINKDLPLVQPGQSVEVVHKDRFPVETAGKLTNFVQEATGDSSAQVTTPVHQADGLPVQINPTDFLIGAGYADKMQKAREEQAKATESMIPGSYKPPSLGRNQAVDNFLLGKTRTTEASAFHQVKQRKLGVTGDVGKVKVTSVSGDLPPKVVSMEAYKQNGPSEQVNTNQVKTPGGLGKLLSFFRKNEDRVA